MDVARRGGDPVNKGLMSCNTRWTKMRHSRARCSGSEASRHSHSSADCITTTCESEFSVHTADQRIDQFVRLRDAVEERASRKFFEGPVEAKGPVVLRSNDFFK
jgi:hypothetical protein